MSKISLVGGSYVYNSLNFDCQRSVNWYPIKSESGTSHDTYALVPTAGLSLFSDLSQYEHRGCWQVLDRAFYVAGNGLYEVYEDGSNELLDTITTSYSGQVSMSDNGGQLCIVDGTPTGGWIFDLATDTLTQITDPYFLGAKTVIFLGGYFVFNKPNSSVYYISAIYDGLNGDPTEFATAEGSPDNLTCLVALQNQGYLIGAYTTETIFNSGDGDFPFSPQSGTFSEFGSKSPFSVVTTVNAIIGLGNDKQGNNVVYMMEGYQPRRISTTPIERILKQYDMTEATAYTYQEDGHTFYVLNAPEMPTTLCYDIDLDLWHEKCYFNPALGRFGKHRGKFHLFAFGKHLISDYENGNIYEQSLELLDDDGVAIRRQRTLPYVENGSDLNYTYFRDFQIDMETGTGEETGNIEDTDPQIYLDWSDDGGHTFKTGRTASIGLLGDTLKRVVFRMLGKARTRVFRLTTSTKAKCFLIGAYVTAEKGTN